MELLGTIEPSRPLVIVAVHLEAEFLETDLPILVTGVGKVAAASSVMAAVAPLPRTERPRALLNVGTAGALRSGFEGTHVIGTVIQHDIDGHAIAALVGSNPAPPLVLGSGATLATGDQFIKDDEARDRLAHHADLVDMEGYAVAEAGRALEVPVSLIKHVSDEANDGAVKSWIESVAECSKILGSWLATAGEVHQARHVVVA